MHKQHKIGNLSSRYRMVGWIFIIPAAFFICFSKFYPMIKALLLSFQKGMGANLTFAGLDNYIRLFGDKLFLTALSNTLIYLAIQVPVMLFLAIIFATILNNRHLRFKGFFRTMIFLPCVTAAVSYSLVFRSLFMTNGLINTILQNMNIIQSPINWLGEAWLARIVIVIAITWRWTGYNTIFYLAGLQQIEPSVYEAATIDGAGPIRRFFSITIPLLRPMILLTAITSTNGTLQLFAEPRNITNGGPANATIAVSNYIYNLSFDSVPRFGYASAISYIVFIIIAVLALIQMKVGDKR